MPWLSNPIPPNLKSVGVRKIEADYHHEGLLDIHLSANHISHNVWFEEVDLNEGTTAYQPHKPPVAPYSSKGGSTST